MVIGDMPFMSYTTPAQALDNAVKLMQEGGAMMVKLEGGRGQVAIVEHLAQLVLAGTDVDVAEAHRAGVHVLERGDAPHQRRLARAVRAEQSEYLTSRHIETDIVERLLAPGIDFGELVDGDGGDLGAGDQDLADLLGFLKAPDANLLPAETK